MLWLIALLTSATAAAATPLQFAWLGGCWQHAGNTSHYEEVWLTPAADLMPGLSRRIGKDGRTREYEFLRIAVDEDGGLSYVAQPSGKPPVRFSLLMLEGTRAVFSNPQHDFPQTITYEFRPPDELHARIEGKQGAKIQAINFPMKRKTCEPSHEQ